MRSFAIITTTPNEMCAWVAPRSPLEHGPLSWSTTEVDHPKPASVVTIPPPMNTISGRARSVGGVALNLTLCAAATAAIDAAVHWSRATGAGFTDSSRRCRGNRSLTKMLSHPQAPSFRQPLGCIAALCRTSKRRFTNFLLE
jgi:hypothetical protein